MKLPTPLTAGQIAGIIGGTLVGDAEASVDFVAVNPLNAKENAIALFTDSQLLKRLDECKARIVIVPQDTQPINDGQTLILVERPKLAIQKICTYLEPKRFFPERGIHETAVIDPSAEIADDAAIGPLVVIGPHSKVGARTVIMASCVIGGKVEIGEDCLIHSGSLLADYVKLGNRVVLQQGASIGSDGFGYTSVTKTNTEHLHQNNKDLMTDERNPLLKIPQIGTVIVEDDVEIGSCTTIDRATMGATIIGEGSKLDNLNLIAHNTVFGKDCIVVGHTAVGGSCTVDDGAVFAGGVRIRDNVRVGKDSVIEGVAAVVKDVPDKEIQIGTPAAPVREYLKQTFALKKLPKALTEIRQLKDRLEELEKSLEGDRSLVEQK